MKKDMMIVWLVLFVAFLLGSCNKEGWTGRDEQEEKDSLRQNNTYVNEWIYDRMSLVYYWNDKMEEPDEFSLSPELFFDGLLYHYNPLTAPDGDRFSFIQSDYVKLLSSFSGVSQQEIGFDYQLYLTSETGNTIVGQVTYVKPNTPAQQAGVQRGWWFDQLQGLNLNTDNYMDLLKNLPAEVSLRFLTSAPQQITDSFEAWLDAMQKDTLRFTVLEDYAESPNFLDSVYHIEDKKIGYFVCNFFAYDSGDGSDGFLLEMNEIFARFKAEGIDELVLDLRYNSGGYVLMSTYLSSMIVPDLSPEKVFCYFRYNDLLQAAYERQYGTDYLLMHFKEDFEVSESNQRIPLNNLNLNRLVVLSGKYTASASEQLINGLKAYMPVMLIGKTTYGKNVSSLTIYENNDPLNKWGIQPIVAKVFNSLGESEYTTGFEPDVELTELSVYDRSALGDTSEILLNAAISLILDRTSSTQRSAKLRVNMPVVISDEAKIKGSVLPDEINLNKW